MRFLVLMMAFGFLASCASKPAAWVHDFPSRDGETAFYQLEHAPFPHESRADGYERGGKSYPADAHYSDNTVAVYIPAGYDTSRPLVFHYYFHGHYNNVRQALDEFRLREMVYESGKNVIFVFPEGPQNVPDSGGGKLEDENGLRDLTEEVHARLLLDKKISARYVDEVILSGHSGAYRIIHHCLAKGGMEDEISEVYLLDSSYAGLDDMAAWMKRNPENRFVSIYTSHLADENLELQQMLAKEKLDYRVVNEDTAFEHVLESTDRLFIEANHSNHDQTVGILGELLATSKVDRRNSAE